MRKEVASAVSDVVDTLEALFGPSGCPWDKKQTLQTVRNSLLEELYEYLEALDLSDVQSMEEELGDVFFNVLFLLKLSEKEGLFAFEKPLKSVNKKLIDRHPHVFGEQEKDLSDAEVIAQWESLKLQEKGKTKRKSALDGIPKGLPTLQKAAKLEKVFRKKSFSPDLEEDGLGKELFLLVKRAKEEGKDLEQEGNRFLKNLEKQFREKERAGDCLKA